MKKIITLLVTVALIMSFSLTAFAAGDVSSVKFTRTNFTFDPASTDLFINFKGLMPGSERLQKVDLINGTSEPAKFYMKMKASEQVYEEGSEKLELVWNLIYDHVDITITDADGNEVYQGDVGGLKNPSEVPGDVTDGIFFLGEVEGKSTEQITVDLTVDPTLGNEYQDMIGHVIWVFIVEQDDEIGEIIIEDETPLVDVPKLPPLEEIVDTADPTVIMLWVGMMLAAPVALVAISKRKSTLAE